MHLIGLKGTTRALGDAHGAPTEVENVDDAYYHDKKEDPHEQE